MDNKIEHDMETDCMADLAFRVVDPPRGTAIRTLYILTGALCRDLRLPHSKPMLTYLVVSQTGGPQYKPSNTIVRSVA